MKKNNFFLYSGILLLCEVVIFIFLHFLVVKIVNQSVFGIFLSFSFLFFMYFFILLARTKPILQKAKDPVKKVGIENIQKYFSNTKKVNMKDLIILRKTIMIKYIMISFGWIIVNIVFSLLAFFV